MTTNKTLIALDTSGSMTVKTYDGQTSILERCAEVLLNELIDTDRNLEVIPWADATSTGATKITSEMMKHHQKRLLDVVGKGFDAEANIDSLLEYLENYADVQRLVLLGDGDITGNNRKPQQPFLEQARLIKKRFPNLSVELLEIKRGASVTHNIYTTRQHLSPSILTTYDVFEKELNNAGVSCTLTKFFEYELEVALQGTLRQQPYVSASMYSQLKTDFKKAQDEIRSLKEQLSAKARHGGCRNTQHHCKCSR